MEKHGCLHVVFDTRPVKETNSQHNPINFDCLGLVSK